MYFLCSEYPQTCEYYSNGVHNDVSMTRHVRRARNYGV